MAMNPAAMMKVMSAVNTFKGNHPKFMAFLSYVFSSGFPEGTVIEITPKDEILLNVLDETVGAISAKHVISLNE